MTPYARSEWDRYADGWSAANLADAMRSRARSWGSLPYAELRAQRNHYLRGCCCPSLYCVPHGWSGVDEPEHHGICADHGHVNPDPLRPPDTDTDPAPRDHFRRGDADLGCGLMVIIAAFAALAAAALLVWIAGRGR
uniref:Uncharacterized protein n=1 Tax=viral metagenome TaxID=1070528 RepID=A0A6M3LS59_9ZZZZ